MDWIRSSARCNGAVLIRSVTLPQVVGNFATCPRVCTSTENFHSRTHPHFDDGSVLCWREKSRCWCPRMISNIIKHSMRCGTGSISCCCFQKRQVMLPRGRSFVLCHNALSPIGPHSSTTIPWCRHLYLIGKLAPLLTKFRAECLFLVH